MTYSAIEVLRAKDFAKLSEEEVHSVTALIHTIAWRPDLRRSRRKRHAAHGAHVDLRRGGATGCATEARRSSWPGSGPS